MVDDRLRVVGPGSKGLMRSEVVILGVDILNRSLEVIDQAREGLMPDERDRVDHRGELEEIGFQGCE